MGQSSETLAVLYVEDDPDSVVLFRRALERHGNVDLLVADSGARALTIASGRPADLAFVDLHLPDMSGSKLVRTLRAEPGAERTAIFLISAATSDELRAELAASGADGYLSKPLDLVRLTSIIERARIQKGNEGASS